MCETRGDWLLILVRVEVIVNVSVLVKGKVGAECVCEMVIDHDVVTVDVVLRLCEGVFVADSVATRENDFVWET